MSSERPVVAVHRFTSAASRRTTAAADRRWLADLAQLPLQLVDLVAEARRFLEPEVARRVLHLVGEALDEPRQLVARQIEAVG